MNLVELLEWLTADAFRLFLLGVVIFIVLPAIGYLCRMCSGMKC